MNLPLRNNGSDLYQTPPYALDPLYKYMRAGSTVWECAAGEGRLSKRLQERGYTVISTDILSGYDFTMWQPEAYDYIVTNPPYSLKYEFLYRAYVLGKPFAFLMPITTLDTAERQGLFSKYGIEIIVLSKKIHFLNSKNDKNGSWFFTAWFTCGLEIGSQLTFSTIKREKL